MIRNDDSLWKLLWDYDPNGLIAVDRDMKIRVVNPALCQMFYVDPDTIIDEPASTILEDADDIERRWKQGERLEPREVEYHGLYFRQVFFELQQKGILGCILVNLTEQRHHERELERVRRETLRKVDEVITNQMKVVQHMASLLGETTAETKSTLLKLIKIIQPGAEGLKR